LTATPGYPPGFSVSPEQGEAFPMSRDPPVMRAFLFPGSFSFRILPTCLCHGLSVWLAFNVLGAPSDIRFRKPPISFRLHLFRSFSTHLFFSMSDNECPFLKAPPNILTNTILIFVIVNGTSATLFPSGCPVFSIYFEAHPAGLMLRVPVPAAPAILQDRCFLSDVIYLKLSFPLLPLPSLFFFFVALPPLVAQL